jgi:lipopolysaccharide biosynthesis protein
MEVLALYLPQYHPVPENDRWWGTGFTEWTNVTRARPLYRGHHQPHLPADLGFTDLRVPETREAQAELARSHGVTGFCYWHYWFAGTRLLERPFDEVLASGRPDFPFCLAWANQTWSGIWHGAPDRVLMAQTYPGPEDDRRHFASLLPAFEDPRYVRVGGRPVFFVYQPGDLPDAARFVDTWQAMAAEAGLGGLYLVASLGESGYRSHVADGFDAGVVYRLPLTRTPWVKVADRLVARGLRRGPRRYPYPDTWTDPSADFGGRLFPGIFPNWDNTPRLGRRGQVAEGSTPDRFAGHVRAALEAAAALPADEQVVLVKSWNEWAEGNYLEPDAEVGRGRLEALRDELARAGHLRR